jgi:hypothetical protein
MKGNVCIVKTILKLDIYIFDEVAQIIIGIGMP